MGWIRGQRGLLLRLSRIRKLSFTITSREIVVAVLCTWVGRWMEGCALVGAIVWCSSRV